MTALVLSFVLLTLGNGDKSYGSVFDQDQTNEEIREDTLDFIYDGFYDNMTKPHEYLEIVTDKDVYFSGEAVSFFIKVNRINNNHKAATKWGFAFLFDDNGKVIGNTRVFLKDGITMNSIPIPRSISSTSIYLSLVTTHTKNQYAKKLLVVTDSISQTIDSAPKIAINPKNKNLVSGRSNSLKITNTISKRQRAILTTEKDEDIREFWLEDEYVVDFTPRTGEKYYLKIDNKKIALPRVQGNSQIATKTYENSIGVSIYNDEPELGDNILMVCAGKEILWLSYTKNDMSEINVPITDVQSSYVFCLLLDKNLNLIDQEIIPTERQTRQPIYTKKSDTLIFEIPSEVRNLPFIANAVESSHQMNTLSFSSEELIELSYYGVAPNNVSFRNHQEKINWLNYNFVVNIGAGFKAVKPPLDSSYGALIYSLPNSVNIDDKLNINAFDYKGEIINYELIGDKIFIDPNEFDHAESVLVLNAKYKKRDIEVTKDTTLVLERLEEIANLYLENNIYYRHDVVYNSSTYSDQIKRLKNLTILKGVTIAGKKIKTINPRRGITKTSDELVLGKYNTSAFTLLPQVGVLAQPTAPPKGYIFSNLRHRPYWGEGIHWPMYLIIRGSQKIYYSGFDFNYSKDYLAKWVSSITRTRLGSWTEKVTISLKPGFKVEESLVFHERIFSPTAYNDNAGVLWWNFQPLGSSHQIKIPLGNFTGSTYWSLQFFDGNGKSIRYSGTSN